MLEGFLSEKVRIGATISTSLGKNAYFFKIIPKITFI